MDKEEEPKPAVAASSLTPDPAEWREKLDRDRREARRRYHQHLGAALDAHGTPNPAELADVALDALLTWRRVSTDDRCMCGCHPSLPSSDFHGYGFDCPCQQTPAEREQSQREFDAKRKAFRESPEGQQFSARNRAERAAVREWVDTQPGVVISEFGGLCPEQWFGSVDGHSFYFRERHEEWRIELDRRPSGRFVKVVRGLDEAGNTITEDEEIDEGDTIATGTVEEPRYGTTLLERGHFIVDTIRTHLTRKACPLHSAEEILELEERLSRPVSWCPACGTRLSTD